MLPVRCYTCNTCIGQHHSLFSVPNITIKTLLDETHMTRMCCRRMFIGYIDILGDQVQYPNQDIPLDDQGTVLKREVRFERTISCD